MVEHVGCFCAELESCSLPYLEILENGEVGIRETRAVKCVSRRIAERIVPRRDSRRSGNKRVLSNRNCVSAEVDTRNTLSTGSISADSVDQIFQTAVSFGLVYP